MIVFTSGTTSKPKGAVTTHGNIAAQIETLISRLGMAGGRCHTAVSAPAPRSWDHQRAELRAVGRGHCARDAQA